MLEESQGYEMKVTLKMASHVLALHVADEEATGVVKKIRDFALWEPVTIAPTEPARSR